MKTPLRSLAMLCSASLLWACAPASETEPESAEQAPAQGASPASASDQGMEEFAGTAWRVMAEDGARYVTYIDAGGRYRDLRNGNLWQEGEWSFDPAPEGSSDGDLLCFLPDAPEEEEVRERCWQPGILRGGKLIVSSGGSRRVELEKISYTAPQEPADAQ